MIYCFFSSFHSGEIHLKKKLHITDVNIFLTVTQTLIFYRLSIYSILLLLHMCGVHPISIYLTDPGSER